MSTSVKRINNNNHNGDDDVFHTKQSSDLVHTRHNFNSNSTKKYVNVINAKFQEIDQSNQTVDNTKGQGIMGKNKTFVSFINFDPKQDISASRSNLANSINNNNNNDEDNVLFLPTMP